MRHTTRQMNQDSGTDDRRQRPRVPGKFGKLGPRGGTIGIIALGIMLAGQATWQQFACLATDGDGRRRRNGHAYPCGSRSHARSGAAAAAGMPQVAATPRLAVMPKHGAGTKRASKPSPSVTPTVTATTATTASPSQTPPSPSRSATPTPTNTGTGSGSGSATCQHPQYTTSDPSGMWKSSLLRHEQHVGR